MVYLCSKEWFFYHPARTFMQNENCPYTPELFQSASLSAFLCCCRHVAQRTRQKTPTKRAPAAAKPAPSPVAEAQPPTPRVSAPKAPLTPVAIAVINGQTITTAEFEPALREQIESVEQNVAETKEDLLELQINTLLLQAEARKRGITSERLYALEVSSKLTQPTPAEIKKFVDENPQQFSGVDSSAAAPQIATYLLAEREEKVSDQFLQRLKKCIRFYLELVSTLQI